MDIQNREDDGSQNNIIPQKTYIVFFDKIKAQFMLILLSTFTVFSLYYNNINEMTFKEILFPLLINIVICEILYFILKFIVKNKIESVFYALLIFYTLLNFKWIDGKQMSSIPYWNTVPIVLYLLFIIIAVIHKTKIKLILDKILVLSILGVLVSYSMIFINNFGNNQNNSAGIETNINKNTVSVKADKKDNLPNIYFIILDEYSSFKQMKKWYDYDNKVFYDYLTNKNFNIVMDSQNESMNKLTLHITTNYINLDYVSTKNNYYEGKKLRQNPKLLTLLEEYGYNITLEGAHDIGWKGSSVNMESRTINGEDIYDLLYGRNIFYPFRNNSQEYIDDISIEKFNKYIEKDKKQSFIYIHFMAGHVPLMYNEEKQNSKNNFFNMKDKSIYIGQYKHITSEIINSINKIIDKDPESVIVVLSDHSQRNLEDANGNHIIPAKDFQQVFNAVYYKGEKLNLDNTLSGVNTYRTVLDKVLGTNMGVINVP